MAARLGYAMSNACTEFENNVRTECDSSSCPLREEENKLFPHRMKFKGFARTLNGAHLFRAAVPPKQSRERKPQRS